MAGLITIRDIRRMLDQCAPGHVWQETEHYYRISYRSSVWPSLPKGPHSSRGSRAGRAAIERGHVRRMIRVLRIDRQCAESELPELT